MASDSPSFSKSLFSPRLTAPMFRTRRSMGVAFAFVFTVVAFTMLFVFNDPSINNSPYWLTKIFKDDKSHLSSFFSRYFNVINNSSRNPDIIYNQSLRKVNGFFNKNNDPYKYSSSSSSTSVKLMSDNGIKEVKESSWWEKMSSCDMFDGEWVKDDKMYPLYQPGSCPHIDESFNCHLNGRPDHGFQNFRWQPKHCNIPRFNGKKMLKLLRGKRLVYVGDSLNRNMWESMVCMLRNSVKNKSKVFEVSGSYEFKKEGAYSFVFEDYNCLVEFIRSPFLVQEWEMEEKNGSKKDTLRLDMVESSCNKYKDADIIVFNTGHWWTHEKTSAGEGYYQEGSHVYSKLDVLEAFRKAMTTWARWIEANIDRRKSLVFFRGYSVSHFSGGEWYSGGKCDTDSEPIKDEKDLSPNLYPPIMGTLENVLKGMKTRVYYLNITRISDFRKDGHPSVYIKPNMTEDERNSLLSHQDCSHWCLPGVPDTWNEILYAQLLINQHHINKPQ